MGKIVAGMASSHAYALEEPTEWDRRRARSRSRFKDRYGTEPPVHPKVAEETMEMRQERYKRIRDGFSLFREQLKVKRPDALILIGDDQEEHFTEENMPQIALYVGDDLFATERGPEGRRRVGRYRCHSALAETLLGGLVERDFDIAFSRSFPRDELISHAHCPILRRVLPEADIPIVPLFINAIHMPTLSPRRCYKLGQAIREIILERPSAERVCLYASGGLSHFQPDYPFRHYRGPYTLGSISEEFDRRAVDLMGQGKGSLLADLTVQDLLANGDVEMKNWIVLLGAIGDIIPERLVYEPFYSGIMGMAVGYWELEDGHAGGKT